jgi:hypothetical protein
MRLKSANKIDIILYVLYKIIGLNDWRREILGEGG